MIERIVMENNEGKIHKASSSTAKDVVGLVVDFEFRGRHCQK